MLVALFPKGENAMAQNATIRPQQIERSKETASGFAGERRQKTRPEAAELLEKDFRKKGERLQSRELSQMLRTRGIIIPAYLIK